MYDLLYPLIIIGFGLGVGIMKCYIAKKNKKSDKLKYYNYRQYEIRHKKFDKNINEQSKITF